VRRGAHLAYPRRTPEEPEQGVLWASCFRTDVADPISTPSDFRHGVSTADVRFELPLAATTTRLTFEAVDTAMQAATEVPFDGTATVGSKRIIEHVRHRYYRDDLSAALDFGAVEPRALVFDHYALVLPARQLATVFGTRIAAGELTTTGGYVTIDGDFWAHAGVLTYDPAAFYQPTHFTDVFATRPRSSTTTSASS